MAVAIDQHSQEQWLANRRNSIGASDVPVILGVSGFKDPYTLWAEKTGQVEPAPPTIMQQLGHHNEPFVASVYSEQTGHAIYNPGDYAVYQHADIDYLTCTPDYLDAECHEEYPVEIKFIQFPKPGEWAEDTLPLYIDVQVQIQMAVLGAKEAVVAALMSGKLEVRHRARHEPLLASLMPALEDFWRHVQDRTEPTVVCEKAMETWRAIHAASDGTTKRLDDALLPEYEAWVNAKAEKAAAAKAEKAAARALQLAIGDADYGEVAGHRLSYKSVNRQGSVRVPYEYVERMGHTEIPHEVTEPTTYRRFLEVKAK